MKAEKTSLCMGIISKKVLILCIMLFIFCGVAACSRNTVSTGSTGDAAAVLPDNAGSSGQNEADNAGHSAAAQPQDNSSSEDNAEDNALDATEADISSSPEVYKFGDLSAPSLDPAPKQDKSGRNRAPVDYGVSAPFLSENESEAKISFLTEGGCYSSPINISLECDRAAAIYYTTDGTDPLTSSSRQLYTGSFEISERTANGYNVIAAVDTALYDSANVVVAPNGKSFFTTSKLPSESEVDKCVIVRAAAVEPDGSATPIKSETYFMGDIRSHVRGIEDSVNASGQTLAIISITADFDDIFGYDNGIYVKGKTFDESLMKELASGAKLIPDTSRRLPANYSKRGREWERRVYMEMFETNGAETSLVLSQSCGIRIQGNYSRSDLFKGFRLYARKDYGKKNFKYPVFGDRCTDDEGKVIDKFATLTLRNGGNCAFTTKYSDTFWQHLSSDLSCETKFSRPCVVYLNGEYFGLYVLEEDYSDDYFAGSHGVDKDSVVLYKGDTESYSLGYKLDIGDLPEGISDESYYFGTLLGYLKNNGNLANDGAFRGFSELVDIDSLADYFAAEIWINNKWDWPGKNWSMWKTKTVDPTNPYADGKWRFCFYDMEFGGVSGKGDAGTNTIKEDNYKKYGLLDTDTGNPAVLCFAYAMKNAGFRELFYARLRGLSECAYERSHAEAVLEAYRATYEPLYPQFFARYPDTGSAENSSYGGYASYKCIYDFLERRAEKIETMISWAEKTVGKMN